MHKLKLQFLIDPTTGFDISPTDEVTFKSSVSKEEIDEAISKNTPGSYIPLLGQYEELFLSAQQAARALLFSTLFHFFVSFSDF